MKLELKPIVRVNFATGTMGCLTIFLALAALFIFFLLGFADLSDNSGRGAAFARMLQSFRIGDFPIGAALFGGYFLFEAGIQGWRWADRTAIALTPDALLLHPSVRRQAILLEHLAEVRPTKRGAYGIKTINPSLFVSWIDQVSQSPKSRTIRNIDLASASGQLFQERLISLEKWQDPA